MNATKFKMSEITEPILQQLKIVCDVPEIDHTDCEKVRAYANQNNMLNLAGWISWNGHHHYMKLLLQFDRDFDSIESWQPSKKKGKQSFRREYPEPNYERRDAVDYFTTKIRTQVKPFTDE